MKLITQELSEVGTSLSKIRSRGYSWVKLDLVYNYGEGSRKFSIEFRLEVFLEAYDVP
ncbi:MAG: hypothetical protein IPL46_20100 [Saprospiraceae bacterium]|nr:hypothetical protein [Saprospiraceae bacterium]